MPRPGRNGICRTLQHVTAHHELTRHSTARELTATSPGRLKGVLCSKLLRCRRHLLLRLIAHVGAVAQPPHDVIGIVPVVLPEVYMRHIGLQ